MVTEFRSLVLLGLKGVHLNNSTPCKQSMGACMTSVFIFHGIPHLTISSYVIQLLNGTNLILVLDMGTKYGFVLEYIQVKLRLNSG